MENKKDIKEINNSKENDNDLVNLFSSFIEKKYFQTAQKRFSENKPLVIDYNEISQFNAKLADELIENPDVWFEYAQEAIDLIDFGIEGKKIIRIFNIHNHKIRLLIPKFFDSTRNDNFRLFRRRQLSQPNIFFEKK